MLVAVTGQPHATYRQRCKDISPKLQFQPQWDEVMVLWDHVHATLHVLAMPVTTFIFSSRTFYPNDLHQVEAKCLE